VSTTRTSLDQLIIDAESALARMESAPKIDRGQRDRIMRASIRLGALQEARDSLRGEAAFFHGGRWVPVAP